MSPSLGPISWRSVRQHEERLDAIDGGEPGAAAHVPGRELAYAERVTDFTTTNSGAGSSENITTAVIGGLTAGPIIGQGRPVEVEFYAPQVRHSVATTYLLAYLIVNDVAQTTSGQNAIAASASATVGRHMLLKRRLVLADGVSYTFKIGIAGGAAGTSTIDGGDGTAGSGPISLSVVAR